MKPKSTNRLLFALRRFFGLQAIFLTFSGNVLGAEQTYLDTDVLNTWNVTDANWDAGVQWTDGNSALFAGTGETVTVTAVTT